MLMFRKDHIARCKDKGMVGFYSPPAKFAVMPETEKVGVTILLAAQLLCTFIKRM